MRDRLIQLISNADEECKHSKDCKSCSGYGKGSLCMNYHIADYLINNGVVVLPCKVGDKTFLLLEKVTGGYDIIESECVRIIENKYSRIFSMAFDCEEIGNTLEFHLEDFERWVFLTREDAERALKGDEGK